MCEGLEEQSTIMFLFRASPVCAENRKKGRWKRRRREKGVAKVRVENRLVD